jgi:2-polyprenyl-3-methyl-5-hydroxy-6-metoxy-1,4-benzoquinol methylase
MVRMIISKDHRLDLKHEHVCCALCGVDNTDVKFKVNLQDTQLSSVWINNVQYQISNPETIVRCKNCGLIYVNPRLALVAGLVPYSVEQELKYFQSSRDVRSLAYQALIGQLPFCLGKQATSLLDVGCGDGMLIEMARQAGIESAGTEISKSLVDLVRERLGEHAIISTDLDELPQSQYDVITLINVIEHLKNPVEMLTTIARLLKPGGILLVHTINIGGLPAKAFGVHWHQIEPLSHFYYFNYRTLGKMLQKGGLEPVDRFNLIISRGLPGRTQRLLGNLGIYLDSGLGIVARRAYR